MGTATSADVTRTTRRGDNCLPFEISSSYVVGGVSGDCTVCVCLSVGGGAWEWQRERARSNEHEFYYLSNVCVCVSCVRVRSAWHGTTREELLTRHRLLHYLSAPEMSCVSYSISIIVRFDSIRLLIERRWTRTVCRRSLWFEWAYATFGATIYTYRNSKSRARKHTNTHTHTQRQRDGRTHTQWQMQSSLFIRLFQLREIFARHTALCLVLDNRLSEWLSCVWGESWIWTELGSCRVSSPCAVIPRSGVSELIKNSAWI